MYPVKRAKESDNPHGGPRRRYLEVEADSEFQRFMKSMIKVRQTRITSTPHNYSIAIRRFFGEFLKTTPTKWLQIMRDAKGNAVMVGNVAKAVEVANEFMTYLGEETEIASGSIKVARSAIGRFLKFNGLEIGDLSDIEITPKKEKSPFSEADARKFIAMLKHHRDRAFFLIGFKSGLRVSELRLLGYDDVLEIFDPTREEPYAIHSQNKHSKGNHGYTSFIDDEACDALRAWIESAHIQKGEFIFRNDGDVISYSTIWRAFNEACKRAGLPNKRIHGMRSYMRTALSRAGCQSDLAAKIIGHGSSSLEQTYTDAIVEQLRTEYAKALDTLRLVTKNNGGIRALTTDQEAAITERIAKKLQAQFEEKYLKALAALPRDAAGHPVASVNPQAIMADIEQGK